MGVRDTPVELHDDWSVALFGSGGEQVSNWYVLRSERTTMRLKGPYPVVVTYAGLWRAGGFVGFVSLDGPHEINCETEIYIQFIRPFGWVPGFGVVSERTRCAS